MNRFTVALFVAAVFSGATASVVGFGIGSLLTPLLAARLGTGIAVAAVMIPHAAATALRCWRLRSRIDRAVLLRFGLLSAAGGLLGALLYARIGASALTRILGGLLLLTALAQLTGWAARWHPRGALVGLLGIGSGFFGGLAGNQGGLRSAALTAFGMTPAVFVATATATGLLVDLARAPVYLWLAGPRLLELWQPIGIAAAGVLVGTLLGERILFGLSPARFARVVGIAIGILGLWLITGATI
ncbi:MAG TPA: sulfite exporter TauE/SafE family protein [Gemmatimonadales bacterium]|nr:sulfite exporter TauE/SafE family protein [Gemmatimonadales bacterium]